ncbi:transglutaminase-like domain-containing protein [Larkinella rosea]|uniref:Transglutaminase domain-containing protein n=1 Tax=Larkinella rosea TaxID=2025312 RepID=A0A3P1BAI1_9BACT|nr:transglutaminase-like domain-containing protein [Larkinella rosea]RRA98045.1 transglutaminase domain-containing protein [Larkinella rosea]
MKQFFLLSLVFIASILVVSCDTKAKKENLLKAVLAHYQSPADSLQRKSAVFLIENIDGLSTGKSETADLGNVDSDYLIKNIDLAVKAASAQLRDGSLSFADFCEYVLPYRLANEPLTDWRQQGLKQFAFLLDTFRLAEPPNMDLTTNINSKITPGFTYSPTAEPAQYQSWGQLMENKKGNCWAMTSLLNYPLRALGVAVATDFVPRWGNNNGETHAWNALRISDKKWVPFMGCESPPGQFDPFGIVTAKRFPGKIFRKTYSINRETLPHLISDQDDIPYQLLNDRIIDVTDLYLPVGDIAVKLDNPDIKMAYLSVFSNGDWSPVFWSKMENNQYLFRKMARRVLYMPSTYASGDGTKPVGAPLYIDSLGKIVICKPALKKRTSIAIKTVQSMAFDELDVFSSGKKGLDFTLAMDSICLGLKWSPPILNQTYNLFYWDNGWQFVGKQKKNATRPLQFDNVPSGAIYRLLPENPTNKERIFTYANGKQTWL